MIRSVKCLSLLICLFLLSSFSCAKKEPKSTTTTTTSENIIPQKMTIKINSQTFTATLLNNNTAKAFLQRLPMTIHMTELNRNEKYFDLPSSLPAQAVKPGNIKAGDIMLYGSKTLVLFYESFETSYGYTKIGTIDNIENYVAALGTGSVTISFESK